MNKIIPFLLILFSWCTTNQLLAQNERENPKYLEGAVPMIDGKVVFTKTYKIASLDKNRLYEYVLEFIEQRLKQNENEISRIVYTNEEKGEIAGVGEEWLVFKSSFLSLDRTLINYQITAFCADEECTMKIEKIKYTYQEDETYFAENWISDKYALNKSKTKLVKGLTKWRVKTVDFIDQYFNDLAQFLDDKINKKVVKVEPEETIQKDNSTIVIGKKEKKAEKQTAVITTHKKEVDTSSSTLPDNIKEQITSGILVAQVGEGPFNQTMVTLNKNIVISKEGEDTLISFDSEEQQLFYAMKKARKFKLLVFLPDSKKPTLTLECELLNQSQKDKEGTHYKAKINQINFNL